MAISKMKKLTLAVFKDDEDKLIEKLMWAGCVEFSDARAGESSYLPAVAENDGMAEAISESARLAEALAVLKKYSDKPKGMFTKRRISEREQFDNSEALIEEAVGVARSAVGYADDIAAIKAQENKLGTQIAALAPWKAYTSPLGVTETGTARVTLGSIPSATDTEAIDIALHENDLACFIESVSTDITKKYIAVYSDKRDNDEAMRVLSSFGFVKAATDVFSLKPIDEEDEIKKSLAELDSRAAANEKALAGLAERAPELEIACDLLSTKIAQLEAKKKFFCTKSAAVMTGWFPLDSEKKVLGVLEGFECWYEIGEPESGDDVPVLLKNNRFAKPFEGVVEMYSLPAYGSFDATPIMAVFYFIIFGFMLGDIVYGLLFSIGGFIAVKKLDLGSGAKKLISMFAICGISCTLVGVLFGSIFGNLPSQVYTAATGKTLSMFGIDIISQTGIFTMIGISIGIGVIHIMVSNGIKFYMLWRDGDKVAAIFDIGSWYFVFAGIGILIAFSKVAGAIVAGIGVLMILCTAGRAKKGIFGKIIGGFGGIYGVIGYASDLISYVRIMALGLSSAVIANVVNIMATMMIKPGFSVGNIVGYILLPIIVVIGHIVNIALNTLGSFIHASRLQYIESFSRFYVDGGRAFEPLAPVTKYTKLNNENK